MTLELLTAITASRWLCGPIWLWLLKKRPRLQPVWMLLDGAWFMATDHYDGQWARSNGLVTEWGYWLDHVGDFLFYGCVFFSLIVGSRRWDSPGRAREGPRPARPPRREPPAPPDAPPTPPAAPPAA